MNRYCEAVLSLCILQKYRTIRPGRFGVVVVVVVDDDDDDDGSGIDMALYNIMNNTAS